MPTPVATVAPAPAGPRRSAPSTRGDTVLTRMADPLFNVVAIGVLVLAIAAIIYPLYFIVIASFSEPSEILNGNVWLLPKGITFEGYTRIFSDPAIMRGFGNSVLYTVVGTAISVTSILSGAYALSRKDMWLFTMDVWTGWSDSLRGVAVGAAGARMARWAGLTHGTSDVACGWLSFIRRVDRPGS